MTAATTTHPAVAVLGTGIIGSPVARNLSQAGFPVHAWNRTADKVATLVAQGVEAAAVPADAVAGAEIVVTVLTDAPAVLETLQAAGPALRPGTVLVQLGTVGVGGIEAIAEFARAHSLTLVDAPVQGTKGPAEAGQLVVLAAGAESVRDRLTPIFDSIGKKTIWISETPGDASKLKLALTTLISAITHGVAESIRLAEALGLDPQLFSEALAGGPLESPFATMKTAAILSGSYEPSFTIDNALKDSRLISEAAKSVGVWLPQAEAGLTRYLAAAEQGHGGQDMAASYFADEPAR